MQLHRSESSIRRKAARDGYLIKTIRSGPHAGELMVIDCHQGIPVAGSWDYGGLDWNEVEAWVYDDADDGREAA